MSKKKPRIPGRVVQGFLKMFSGSDLTATKTPRDRNDLLACCVMGFSISIFPKQPLVAFAVHEHDQGNGNQNGWKEEEETTCDYGNQNAQCPCQHFHGLSPIAVKMRL